MKNQQTWCNAITVLKPQTLKVLERRLDRTGINLVDGWAATNPDQLRDWEGSGVLLEKALEAENQAAEAKRQAQADGQTHLSDTEINELYGGPSHRL